MRAGVAQGGIISPVLFSLYVDDMPSPSRQDELALCGRYGHHSHVPSASAPRQIPGYLSQRPRTVVE